jgi:hypothetical protein
MTSKEFKSTCGKFDALSWCVFRYKGTQQQTSARIDSALTRIQTSSLSEVPTLE